MRRRVGSPKASVIADTAAVKAVGASRPVGAAAPPPATPAREPWSAEPSRYSTYGRSANSPHRRRPRHEGTRCPSRETRSSTPSGRSRIPSCTARSSTSAWSARSTRPPTARSASSSPSPSPGCPLKNEITEPRRDAPSTAARRRHVGAAVDFTVMTDQEREALRIQLQGDRPRPRPQPGPRPRRGPGDPVRPARLADPPAVHLVRQGRRRQVQRHHQPRRRPRRPGPLGRHRRRRHLRLLDPPHARRRPRADGDRRDAAAARGVGRALHLDRLLRARGPGRRSGAARCCTRRSSSSSPTSTGTSPTSCSSTCRPAPATSPSRLSQYLPRGEVYVVTTPQPAAQKVARLSAAMAAKVNLPVSGVIENMSWFTGDDGKRYEIFGVGRRRRAGRRARRAAARPAAAASRRCATVATTGKPIAAVDPDSETGRAFHALAERIAVELRPKKVFSSAAARSSDGAVDDRPALPVRAAGRRRPRRPPRRAAAGARQRRRAGRRPQPRRARPARAVRRRAAHRAQRRTRRPTSSRSTASRCARCATTRTTSPRRSTSPSIHELAHAAGIDDDRLHELGWA